MEMADVDPSHLEDITEGLVHCHSGDWFELACSQVNMRRSWYIASRKHFPVSHTPMLFPASTLWEISRCSAQPSKQGLYQTDTSAPASHLLSSRSTTGRILPVSSIQSRSSGTCAIIPWELALRLGGFRCVIFIFICSVFLSSHRESCTLLIQSQKRGW